MEIKSVALLGAGAVGSYIIWGLSKLPDIRFGIIAEGSRAARLRDEGCSINNVTYHPQVWSPQEAKGVDLLIVALKYGALPGALASIREAVGPNTTVMSTMNGVDGEKIIAGAIDSKQILPALIKIASRHDGNGVRFNPEKTIGIVFGEAQAPFESERVLAIEALCAAPISISAIRIALMKKSGASSARTSATICRRLLLGQVLAATGTVSICVRLRKDCAVNWRTSPPPRALI